MKNRLACLLCVVVFVSVSFPLFGQEMEKHLSKVFIPDSTVERSEDVGLRAHTNHIVVLHSQKGPSRSSTPSGETPATIRPVYNLPSTGGSNVIAIVDAYDYPSADNDLTVFSTTFNLPICNKSNGCFQVVYASGSKPRANCGWAQEAALDIEWAHAMAPNARIILVEAKSSSFTDLFHAVDVAGNLVSTTGNGVGEVSMSWGGSEFSSESGNDSHFTKPGVVYFAASGDTGGATIYPSASPNVVAAGGTRINRDGSGNFISETGWSGSGGGPSKYELRPAYQNGISTIVGTHRGIPDFSFDADPASGVSVYDTTSCQGQSGWLVFGGTSVASPSLSGIVNLAASLSGIFQPGSVAELSKMYSDTVSGNPDSWNPNDFRDILTGTAGSNTAKTGWDFVTGIGSNQGTLGK